MLSIRPYQRWTNLAVNSRMKPPRQISSTPCRSNTGCSTASNAARSLPNGLLSMATAVEESWLKEIFPDDYRETRGVTYDEAMKRVVSRRERRFRDLVLEAKMSSDEAPLNEAAALLTKEVVEGRLKLEAWDDAVEQWIVRVNRMAEWIPELEVNPLTEADRTTLIEQICYGELGYRDIKDKPVMPILRDWLTAEQLAVIDDYLPERLTMGNGRRSRLTYHKEGPPVLSARIQELFGIEGKFTIGHGRAILYSDP